VTRISSISRPSGAQTSLTTPATLARRAAMARAEAENQGVKAVAGYRGRCRGAPS